MGGGGRYILVAVLVNIKHSMGWWSWRYRLLGQAGGGRGEQGRVIVDIAGVDRDSHRHGEPLLQPLASLQRNNKVQKDQFREKQLWKIETLMEDEKACETL